MKVKQLTKEKKSVMRNLTKEELIKVQGGNGGFSMSVHDNGNGGCIDDPFAKIIKKMREK